MEQPPTAAAAARDIAALREAWAGSMPAWGRSVVPRRSKWSR